MKNNLQYMMAALAVGAVVFVVIILSQGSIEKLALKRAQEQREREEQRQSALQESIGVANRHHAEEQQRKAEDTMRKLNLKP